MFAKLYESELGQILVKSDLDPDEKPEVRFYFKPSGLGVCSVAITFDSDDEGYDNREAYFDSVDNEKALNVVGAIMDQLLKQV